MNKKILCMILCMVLIITMMSGCKLASEDSKAVANSKNPDIVCGVFVSFDPTYTEEGNNVGIKRSDGTIGFNGLNGYYMGVEHKTDKNGEYISNIADKEFQEINTAINVEGEKSQTATFEGKLYFDHRFQKPIYPYQVYQRPDKSYYCLRVDNGVMVDADTAAAIKIKTSKEEKSNGKTVTQTEIYNIKFDTADISNKVLIKEMDSKDKLIKTTEYHQKDSDNYVVNKNTAYVIVEETFKQESGSDQIKRAVYSVDHKLEKDEEIRHRLFYPGTEGALIPKMIHFKR